MAFARIEVAAGATRTPLPRGFAFNSGLSSTSVARRTGVAGARGMRLAMCGAGALRRCRASSGPVAMTMLRALNSRVKAAARVPAVTVQVPSVLDARSPSAGVWVKIWPPCSSMSRASAFGSSAIDGASECTAEPELERTPRFSRISSIALRALPSACTLSGSFGMTARSSSFSGSAECTPRMMGATRRSRTFLP